RMPYVCASWAARSGRRSVATSLSAGQPERNSPASRVSPICPAPITAMVCILSSFRVDLGLRVVIGDQLATLSPRSTVGGMSSGAEEDLGLGVALQGYGLELLGALDQRHPHDLRAPQRHHLAPVALVHGIDRVQAEPGGEDPVVRGRGAAALDVPEHH